MKWNSHSILEGTHAFLGASQYHWLNYDEDKLVTTYINFLAKQRGTELHEFAKRAIELGIKLPNNRQTLSAYVNDAIGFKMKPEQVLYYSENCYGTADAICFRRNLLRIHDLKTGTTPASMNQLYIYDALFCLEYHVKPDTIKHELRIYQLDDVRIDNPEPELIYDIMQKIIYSDKIINKVNKGELQ